MKKLIVGLGNPGEKYKNTRHNIGFLFVESYLAKMNIVGTWQREKKFFSEVLQSGEYIFVKPLTFMNNSGVAVLNVSRYYDVHPDSILVVHDDIDLEIGDNRLQKGRGSAGHNGVQDIINKLSTNEFWRYRIGVGRPASNEYEVKDYVLSKFDSEFVQALASNFRLPF